MSKKYIALIVIALLLILIGGSIFLFALGKVDFDFSKLATEKLVTNTYEISDGFENIIINLDTTDVTFALSNDGKCSVEFVETKKLRHTVNVFDNTLKIGIIDSRKWFEHIGIFFENMKMTLYLPLEKYSSHYIDNDTGDIKLPYGIFFDEIKIEADTSDVECNSSGTKKVMIENDTGDVVIGGGYSDINVSTDTGEIDFNNVKCMTITAESDTGNITFKETMAITTIDAETDTGDIVFKNSDAGKIKVKSATGDVKGSLLTSKIFNAESSTGKVRVPKNSIDGGVFDARTSTGDIKIEIN